MDWGGREGGGVGGEGGPAPLAHSTPHCSQQHTTDTRGQPGAGPQPTHSPTPRLHTPPPMPQGALLCGVGDHEPYDGYRPNIMVTTFLHTRHRRERRMALGPHGMVPHPKQIHKGQPPPPSSLPFLVGWGGATFLKATTKPFTPWDHDPLKF